MIPNDQAERPRVPLPANTSRITSIHDGTRWLRGVHPASIRHNPEHDTLTFLMDWSDGTVRRFTLAMRQVAGFQERA